MLWLYVILYVMLFSLIACSILVIDECNRHILATNQDTVLASSSLRMSNEIYI